MISACILTKNDAAFIAETIESIRPFVQEIIVTDDGSTDNTIDIALQSGADKIRKQVVDIASDGFAAAANEMIEAATQDWIFIIDSDELLAEAEHLQTLTRYPDKEAWALPRRKWERYPVVREEYEAYPDWQVRFFKNIPENRFEGHMHVRFMGKQVHRAYRGPHIEHLQLECRTPEKDKQRKELYEKLAAKQGVKIKGGRKKEKK